MTRKVGADAVLLPDNSPVFQRLLDKALDAQERAYARVVKRLEAGKIPPQSAVIALRKAYMQAHLNLCREAEARRVNQ